MGSSQKSLKTKGLSWAPASPALHASINLEEPSSNGYDGGASYRGYVTPDGLVADWLLFRLDGSTFWSWVKSRPWQQTTNVSQHARNFAKIRARYLKGYRWGAILCPIQESGSSNMGVWWEDGGRMRRTVVAVCATNQTAGTVAEKYTFNNTIPTKVRWDYHGEVKGWEWRGVYAWDDAEPLPPLRRVEKFLIS